MYLKDPGMGSINAITSNQNVTLPLIFDSADDSSFEPQFVRIREANTATFCPNNIAQELGESAVINMELNAGQTIFNIAKRVYMSNAVIDVDVIDNIRPGNNVLRFSYSAVVYTITFKNMLIKSSSDLISYLNNIGSWNISPAFPTFALNAAAATDHFNPNFIRLEFIDTSGPTTLTVTVDMTSPFLTNGDPMWGTLNFTNPVLTNFILNPGYLPAYYWDFKSVLLTKWSKTRNWNGRNTSDNIYRYYFKTRSGKFTNFMNWNKESITQFDLSIVDDQGVAVFNGYTFSGPPFIAIEIVGSQ